MDANQFTDTAAVWLAQGFLSGMRTDGWANNLTGMGTSRDKTQSSFFLGRCDLDDQAIESLYAHDDTAGRIVNEVVDESWRAGYRLELEDDRLEEEWERIVEEYELVEKLPEVDAFGRAYGESLLLFGVNDGASSTAPLKFGADAKIDFVEVLDRRYYCPASYYMKGPKSGKPETYSIGTPGPNPRGGFIVHESRVIPFGGARTTRTEKQRRGWRDHSVLQAPFEVLRAFATGFSAVEQLLTDGPQGVYSIPNLKALISAQGSDKIEARLELIERMRSFVRAIAIDGDEKFERQSMQFAGVPDALDRLMLRLCSAAYYPMLVLFGVAPSGFGDGATSILWYQDRTRARQANYISPRLKKLARIFLGSRAPEKITVCWNPLHSQTPKEEADTAKTWADTDKVYFDMGIEPEALFQNRFGERGWKSGYAFDEEQREQWKTLLKIADERAIEEAENPPPPPVPGALGAPGAPGELPLKPGKKALGVSAKDLPKKL